MAPSRFAQCGHRGRRKRSVGFACTIGGVICDACLIFIPVALFGCGSTSNGSNGNDIDFAGDAAGTGSGSGFGEDSGQPATEPSGLDSGNPPVSSGSVVGSGPPPDAAVTGVADDAAPGDASGNVGDASPVGDSSAADASDGAPGGPVGSSACAGGMSWPATDAPGGEDVPVTGYGAVEFQTATTTQIVGLETTLLVPANPTSSSTLYVWPGLEPLPQGAHFDPVGQGVLQPVLTWGTSCGKNTPADPRGWWISAQYVNPYTYDSSFYGCLGGDPIDVQVSDQLNITMSLKGTVWSQVVLDKQTGQSASYDIDMMGQAQDWALFHIEQPTQNSPTSDVIFTSTTLTFAAADPMACHATKRGTNDYIAASQSSADGTTCCIAKIILRAQGVAATTPNGP